MDQDRFDRLARFFGKSISRRGAVLGALVTGAPIVGNGAAAAKSGRPAESTICLGIG